MQAPNLASVETPTGADRAAERPTWARSLAVILLLAVATVAAVIVGNGNVAVALVPSALALVVWGAWFLPLRIPMMVLLFLAWALEVPGDAFTAVSKAQRSVISREFTS